MKQLSATERSAESDIVVRPDDAWAKELRELRDGIDPVKHGARGARELTNLTILTTSR